MFYPRKQDVLFGVAEMAWDVLSWDALSGSLFFTFLKKGGHLIVASHLVHHPELISELSQKVSQSCLKNCCRFISKIFVTNFVLLVSCLVPSVAYLVLTRVKPGFIGHSLT